MKTDIITSTFIRFRSRLHSVAAGIAGADNAEDVIHDAFCRLWTRHPDVVTETEAMKLSYTVVKNSALDSLRRTRSHPTLSIDDTEEIAVIPDDTDMRQEQRQTYEAVIRLSRKALNERQFEIFRLHDIEGVSYDEISAQLGITAENVRMILSRARKTIRELYNRQ